MPLSVAQYAVAAKDRKKDCIDEKLPAEYEQFLDTSFLGKERTASVGNTKFAYYRFGPLHANRVPGRTLVMIVGLACTKSTWTPDLLKTLAATREVLIFDNKGSGRSVDPDWPDDLSIRSYAESTMELIETLGIQQPDVLGWSMGGIISSYIATHFGSKVHRFVLVNTFVPKPSNRSADIDGGSSFNVHLWKGQGDPQAFYPDTAAGNAGLCRYIKLYEAMPENSITTKEVDAQIEIVTAYLKQAGEIYRRLPDVQNPTLVYVGTYSGEGPASYSIASQIQKSMVVAFSDAAHGAIFQHGPQAALTISAFLESSWI